MRPRAVVNYRAEPINGERWRRPSRLAAIYFTDQGLVLPKQFLEAHSLSHFDHVRVFIWASRSQMEFWLQFHGSPQPNTLSLQPAPNRPGAMLIQAPGFLIGRPSYHAGGHEYKLRSHANETIYVVTLDQRR